MTPAPFDWTPVLQTLGAVLIGMLTALAALIPVVQRAARAWLEYKARELERRVSAAEQRLDTTEQVLGGVLGGVLGASRPPTIRETAEEP